MIGKSPISLYLDQKTGKKKGKGIMQVNTLLLTDKKGPELWV